jgi:hypothetical protein
MSVPGSPSAAFWMRRFCVAFVVALVIIAGAQRLKGFAVADVINESALWAAIAAALYTAVRIYRTRKNQYCALCGDTPETIERARDAGRK